MTSDNERREVAARLRKAIGLTEFAEALGFNWTDDSDWGWKDVSNLVADLIEPSCYLDTPQKVAEEMFGKMRHPTKEESDAYEATLESMSVEIHPVDRDALLALADEMGRVRSKCDFCIKKGDCDWADETICLESHIDDYARCIREALGVVE